MFAAEIAAPWVVSLKIPNRGRVMIDDRRVISIKVRKVNLLDKKVHSTYSFQNTQYTVGDPAFEFIVRPYENKKITFESRKFAKSFLSVDQNAAVSVREMPPDSGEVQFVVRVQVHTYKILFPWYMLRVKVYTRIIQMYGFRIQQGAHCSIHYKQVHELAIIVCTCFVRHFSHVYWLCLVHYMYTYTMSCMYIENHSRTV